MANTFKRFVQADVASGGSTVYTVPALTTAVVIGLNVANKTVNNLAVSCQMAGVQAIGTNTPVPMNSALNGLAGKVVLEAGDTVVVTANANTSLDAILSVMEIS